VSARAKTSFSIVDRAFDAPYNWGTPAPPKPISRPDKTMSPEQALWLSVLNVAWVDALTVPKELVCGPEAKGLVGHIERYLQARDKASIMFHLRHYPKDAKTDPYYRECHALYGHPSHGDYQKAQSEARKIGRPPYHLNQIECLRAWLWITEQHPSFRTACHLSGCDPEGVSDGIYRAVTGRGRARPKLVHVAPID